MFQPSRSLPAGVAALLLAGMLFGVVTTSAVAADTPDPKTQALFDSIDRPGGLAVVLGCGDGRLSVGLASQGKYVVLALDTDPANVAATRQRAESQKVAGTVSVDHWDGKTVPTVDGLVNLLVVEDPAGTTETERLRAMAPGGAVATVATDGRASPWRIHVKPPVQGTDEWTHYLHDASGNAVADDTRVGPPRHVQWLADPIWSRNHHTLASTSAMVTTGGRIFSISDEGDKWSMDMPGVWSLVARDAHSGVLLWKRPIETWAWHKRKFRSGPAQLPRTLVADEDHVYAPKSLSSALCCFDAATGELVREYAETDAVEEIVLDAGTLLVVVGSPMPQQAMADPRFANMPSGNRRKIVACRAADGEVLWQWAPEKGTITPLSLAAGDGKAVVAVDGEIVCLDASDGKIDWRATTRKVASSKQATVGSRKKPTANRAPDCGSITLVLNQGVVVVAERGQVTALSIDDGKILWQGPCGPGFRSPTDLFVIDSLVWTGPDFSIGRDLRTGEVKQTNTAQKETWTVGHHHRCYREKATSQWIITGKRGLEFLDPDGDNHNRNNWVRGGCQYGILPANGMVYLPPHACGCYMEAKVIGFWALSPEKKDAGSSTGSASTPCLYQRGPAGERIAAVLQRGGTPRSLGDGRGGEGPNRLSPRPSFLRDVPPTDAWPTLRGNAGRSGSTPTAIDLTAKGGWTTRVGGRLSPPVVGGGVVLVSVVDEHRVVALDADSGKPRWNYTTGGRINSPPTIHGPVALFGSADGWVYAVAIDTGELAWRFRSAVADTKVVARDQVESVWPVAGSVLVQNGLVYVASGRSTYLDGGIRVHALDPATGKVRFQHTLRVAHPEEYDRNEPETDSHRESFVQNAHDFKTFTHPDRSDSFSMHGTTNDVLVGDGESVYLRHLRLDARCRPVETPANHLFSTTTLTDDAELHRTHWVFGSGDFSRLPVAYSWIANSTKGKYGARLSVPYGLMLAFDNDQVWGVRRVGGGYALFAEPVPPAVVAEPDFRKSNNQTEPPWAWSTNLTMRPRAMIRAADVLVIGGIAPSEPLDIVTDQVDSHGMLSIRSTADGHAIADRALPAEPVFDGLAAAAGRLYVSTTEGEVMLMGR